MARGIGAVGEGNGDEENYGDYRYWERGEMLIGDRVDEVLDGVTGHGEHQESR